MSCADTEEKSESTEPARKRVVVLRLNMVGGCSRFREGGEMTVFGSCDE